MTDFIAGFLVLFPLFMTAVIAHELSHGLVALYFGDNTARLAGRLTLNPLKHMDWVGTLLLPLFLRVLNAPFVFGWAKPVPINILNMRHPKRDMLWVGAAGPAANFLLAGTVSLLIRGVGSIVPPLAVELAKYLILINLVLGTFNLLPIPPLDGSRVLTGLLPAPLAVRMIAMERWGIVLVFLLLYLGVINRILWPIVGFLARMLGV